MLTDLLKRSPVPRPLPSFVLQVKLGQELGNKATELRDKARTTARVRCCL